MQERQLLAHVSAHVWGAGTAGSGGSGFWPFPLFPLPFRFFFPATVATRPNGPRAPASTAAGAPRRERVMISARVKVSKRLSAKSQILHREISGDVMTNPVCRAAVAQSLVATA